MLRSLIAVLFVACVTDACKCVPPQDYKYYVCNYPVVLRAKIGNRARPPSDREVAYRLNIIETYKNDTTGVSVTARPVIYTAKDSAACGYKFTQHQEYLLFASLDDQGYSTNSCARNTKWEDVPADVIQKLQSGELLASCTSQ